MNVFFVLSLWSVGLQSFFAWGRPSRVETLQHNKRMGVLAECGHLILFSCIQPLFALHLTSGDVHTTTTALQNNVSTINQFMVNPKLMTYFPLWHFNRSSVEFHENSHQNLLLFPPKKTPVGSMDFKCLWMRLCVPIKKTILCTIITKSSPNLIKVAAQLSYVIWSNWIELSAVSLQSSCVSKSTKLCKWFNKWRTWSLNHKTAALNTKWR